MEFKEGEFEEITDVVENGEKRVRLRRQNLETMEIGGSEITIPICLAKEICDRNNREDQNFWWWYE